MRLFFIFVLPVLILTASCGLADSLSNFDCSTENEVYNLLLRNHDVWIDELYDMGEYTMGPRGIYLPEGLGVVYVTGPDGMPLGYREWDIEDKLLVVRTARDIYVDGDQDYGIFGSFGYIYSEQPNLSEVFTEYDFKMLSRNIYCYSINR